MYTVMYCYTFILLMSLYSFCLYMYIDLMNSNKKIFLQKKIKITIPFLIQYIGRIMIICKGDFKTLPMTPSTNNKWAMAR